jgi:hypothetical protein
LIGHCLIALALGHVLDRGWPGVALAQTGDLCAGDCSATNAVSVNDLITLASIALGTAPSSACPSGIPSGAQTDVALILQAVNNAQNGCPPIDVSGTWQEDQYRLLSSDCDSGLTNAILSAAEQPPVCDYQLSQDGVEVTARDCVGNVAMGMVDATGTLRFDLPSEQQTQNGCMVGISPSETVPVSHSPTVATFTLPITFSGACGGFSNCTIIIQATWTRL